MPMVASAWRFRRVSSRYGPAPLAGAPGSGHLDDHADGSRAEGGGQLDDAVALLAQADRARGVTSGRVTGPPIQVAAASRYWTWASMNGLVKMTEAEANGAMDAWGR
jgi:hypothetical protein